MAKQRGTGSIRHRKDGRWEASLTIGYNQISGNPKRVTRCTKKDNNTKVEAEKILSQLIHEHGQGTLSEVNSVTVNEWLDTWLSSKTGIEEGTRIKYSNELKPIRERLGRSKLQKVRPTNVRQAYNDMVNKGCSQRALKKAKTHLNAALKLAVVEEVIARNPAEAVKVEKPRVSTEKKAQAWTPSQVQTFLDGALGDIRYNAFYTMLTLGLRRGETLGLRWQDVDLESGQVRIRKSYSEINGRPVMKGVKTEKSKRTLYLSQDLIMMFGTMSKKNNKGLVFQSMVGTPIHPRNLNRSFYKIIKDLPVPKIRVHDLRHTHATLALQRGVQVEHVSERLGHASVSITLDTYRHLYEPERREAALSLTDLLSTQPRMAN